MASSQRCLLFLVFLLSVPISLGFVANSATVLRPALRGPTIEGSIVQRSNKRNKIDPRMPCIQRPGTQLHADTGGIQRGVIIFGFVLALNIWAFSIPPEFRRAKICSEEQSEIYEQCKTLQQWTQGVKDYYKNGGGIHFDFSIDPATLQENEEFRQSLFNK